MTWLRKPWVGPLAFVVVAFVAFSLPPYLTGDRLQARVQSDWGPHYPLLVVHVVCGAIAILTCVVQIWPWFRARFPSWHRRIGRVYVLAGVLPAGVSGLFIGWMTPFGPVAQVSNVLLAVLWLAFTWLAWRAARQRRFRDHRKWMIRSFVLTISIITNRIWGVFAFLAFADRVPEAELPATIAGISTWAGWTVPLLISQWWLERKPRRRAVLEPREAAASDVRAFPWGVRATTVGSHEATARCADDGRPRPGRGRRTGRQAHREVRVHPDAGEPGRPPGPAAERRRARARNG